MNPKTLPRPFLFCRFLRGFLRCRFRRFYVRDREDFRALLRCRCHVPGVHRKTLGRAVGRDKSGSKQVLDPFPVHPDLVRFRHPRLIEDRFGQVNFHPGRRKLVAEFFDNSAERLAGVSAPFAGRVADCKVFPFNFKTLVPGCIYGTLLPIFRMARTTVSISSYSTSPIPFFSMPSPVAMIW